MVTNNYIRPNYYIGKDFKITGDSFVLVAKDKEEAESWLGLSKNAISKRIHRRLCDLFWAKIDFKYTPIVTRTVISGIWVYGVEVILDREYDGAGGVGEA